jgi:predicted flavoprotein YhiN
LARSRAQGKADALVIGTGPAGLMAAETLVRAGRAVTLVEAKPSAGRKFLMAGKSGLNITKDEPLEAFKAAYGSAEDWLSPMLDAFGPREAMDWAEASGAVGFHRQHGRVFPDGDEGLAAAAGMAAADRGGAAAGLALGRLGRRGWVFETASRARCFGPASRFWRWAGQAGGGWGRTGNGPAIWPGRASTWPRSGPPTWGSRGLDAAYGAASGPAAEIGAPDRGGAGVPGEAVISARGIEGGGVYAVSAAVRDGAPFAIDLAPDRSVEDIAARLAARPGSARIMKHLGRRWASTR